MTISELETLLSTLCPNHVWHRVAPPGEPVRVVWQQYGWTFIEGDNAPRIRVPLVQVDVYTQSESDTLVADLMSALETAGQSYSIADVSYDEEECAVRTIFQLELF